MSGKCQNDRLLFICKGDGYVDIAELPLILEKAGLSREGTQNTRYNGQQPVVPHITVLFALPGSTAPPRRGWPSARRLAGPWGC